MRIRYLVSLHEVHASTPVQDSLGALIGFTTQQHNGVFALELTREQWEEMRRTRWATPVLDGGFLIPDVDFEASDGQIFATFEECMQHETTKQTELANGYVLIEPNAGDDLDWPKALQEKQAASKIEDFGGKMVRAGILVMESLQFGKKEVELIRNFEAIFLISSQDFGTRIEIAGIHSSFEEVIFGGSEETWTRIPRYCRINGEIIPTAPFRNGIFSHGTISQEMAVSTAQFLAAQPNANPSVESRILNAVAGGSIHINLLVDTISVNRESIKEAVKNSPFLCWSGPRVALSHTTIPA